MWRLDMKTCARCRKELDDGQFRVRKSGALFSYCKPCEVEYKKAYYEANADKVREKTRRWTNDNKARKSAADKAYREANAETIKARQQDYYLNRGGKEKHLAVSRKWRELNKEKALDNESRYRDRNREVCNARIASWKRSNKGLVTHYQRRREADLGQRVPSWADSGKIAALYAEASRMRSDGLNVHVDHIVPLRGKKVSGLHCENNLRIIPSEENLRKSNKWEVK